MRSGLVAGVAEHHSLVAGALLSSWSSPARCRADLFALVDALRDVGALLVDATMTPQVLPSKP
jgi:hypothetical protein